MKSLVLPAIAAFIGAVALVFMAGRFHPAHAWGFRFDRGQAIALAKAQANALGVPADGWNALVNQDTDTQLDYYQSRHPEDPAAQALSPFVANVVLASPDGRSSIYVQLASDARVAAWERKEEGSKSWTMNSMRSAVDAAFRQIAGPNADQYHPLTEGAATKEGLRFTWERLSASAAFQPTIDVIVQDGAVVHAETHYSFDKQFNREYDYRDESMDWFRLAYGSLYFVLALSAAILYAVGSIRKKVKQRFAITLAVVNFASLLLAFPLGSRLENLRSIKFLGGPNLYFGDQLAIGYELGTGLLLALAAAGGGLFAAGILREKWWSLRLLLSRRAWSQQVGRSIGAGILSAPLLAAVPLIVGAAFPAAIWDVRHIVQLFSPHPVLETCGYLMHPTSLVFFGGLFSLLWNRVRPGLWRYAAAALPATLFFIGFHDSIHAPTAAIVLAGGLIAVSQIWLFLHFDILTILAAETGLTIVNLAIPMLLQPAPGLQSIGWQALCALGALLGAGLVMLWKAPDVPSGETDTALEPLSVQSEREELKAEFLVAQRAQREMLPSQAPALAGFTLAASCTPAREVGGDLYDFLPMSRDRLAIAVADVSGKGVPAALYMTLTKGLLAATAQDDLTLASMLEEMNTHLCTVGQRKTFVTMALGILDPAARSLEYARAGHNPTVWRRPSLGTTSLLNSKGVGLGITAGRVFGRTLVVEKLDLTSGDTLVFYSDGLTEAMNEELEQFGEERLMQAVEKVDGMAAGAARDAILRDVADFLGGLAPQDDLTLVVLRVD